MLYFFYYTAYPTWSVLLLLLLHCYFWNYCSKTYILLLLLGLIYSFYSNVTSTTILLVLLIYDYDYSSHISRPYLLNSLNSHTCHTYTLDRAHLSRTQANTKQPTDSYNACSHQQCVPTLFTSRDFHTHNTVQWLESFAYEQTRVTAYHTMWYRLPHALTRQMTDETATCTNKTNDRQ